MASSIPRSSPWTRKLYVPFSIPLEHAFSSAWATPLIDSSTSAAAVGPFQNLLVMFISFCKFRGKLQIRNGPPRRG